MFLNPWWSSVDLIDCGKEFQAIADLCLKVKSFIFNWDILIWMLQRTCLKEMLQHRKWSNKLLIWLATPGIWLYLLKHKLELMFSSIDPCAPLTCDFLAIDFPPLGLQHVFYPGLHCYQPIKRFIRTCFLITTQSAPSCFTVHALVDWSQSISNHNSVLARL